MVVYLCEYMYVSMHIHNKHINKENPGMVCLGNNKYWRGSDQKPGR